MTTEALALSPDQDFGGSSYLLPEQSNSAEIAVCFKNSLRETQETPLHVVDFNDVMGKYHAGTQKRSRHVLATRFYD
jgi:hypothetical protein